MSNSIEVILSPALRDLYDLRGKVVVVIDVFRATTTMCAALHNGAKSVIPVMHLEDAQEYQSRGYLLGGERNGIKMPGFDFGNSPKEYTAEKIKDQDVVLTTTNGTKTVSLSADADAIIIGAFVNMSSVVSYLSECGKDVVLFCAGWKNRVNMEDSLFAGYVVNLLKKTHNTNCDSAILVSHWAADSTLSDVDLLQKGSHAQRFKKLGVTDLEYCLERDIHPVLPLLIGKKLIDGNPSSKSI